MSSLSTRGRLSHLRPLGVGEMLDRAMAVIASRPWLFILLAVLFVAPDATIACLLWVRAGKYTATDSIVMVALIIAANWAAAFSIVAAFQNMLVPDRTMAWRAMAAVAFTRLPGFFLTRLLAQALVVSLVLLIPRALITQGPAGAALAILLVMAGGVLHLRWALVPVIVLIEDDMFFKALRRSSSLMFSRGKSTFFDSSLWRYLVVSVIPAALFALGALGFVAGMHLLYPAMDAPAARHQKLAILGGGNAAGLLMASAFYWAGLVFVYAEVRMRREGMDLLFRVLEARTANLKSR